MERGDVGLPKILVLIPKPFYPQNHVGRGWGIRNGANGRRAPTQDPSTNDRWLFCRRRRAKVDAFYLPHNVHLASVLTRMKAGGAAVLGDFNFTKPKLMGTW